ncbi:hypothetical protein LEP1GSC170_5200 [Leptospira interrogans serovar Bataviae str. HAI135]|nr:hypothetical protein LEP1GSC170_5200 [Leptospira interrogans serovar Bataviae str. HAI135]
MVLQDGLIKNCLKMDFKSKNRRPWIGLSCFKIDSYFRKRLF